MNRADNDNLNPRGAADARSAAAFIDLIVVIPCAAVANPVAQAAYDLGAPWWASLATFAIAWPLVVVAVQAAFESSWIRATPGKFACGLCVVAADGGRAGLKACMKRNFFKFGYGILGIPFMIRSGWAPDGALHDRRAGTLVIPREKRA